MFSRLLLLWGHFQLFQKYEARLSASEHIQELGSTDTKNMPRYLSEAGVWRWGKGFLIY